MVFVAAPGRRRLLTTAAGGVAALSLGACATGEKRTEAPAVPKPSGGPFPVTIATAFGNVTVPKQPERVVALGWSDAETALALGVRPVGQADWMAFGGDGQGPWNRGRYATPPARLGTLEVNMEAVAVLKPDLILDTRSSGTKERHDQLAGLGVPVVGIPAGGEAYLTSWEQQLDLIGRALGRSERAAQLRAGLEGKFAQAAAAHPAFEGKTVVVGARSGAGYGAYVGGSRVEFLERLGFTNSPEIASRKRAGSFSVDISREQLNLFDADLTVLFLIGTDRKEVTDDPLFQAVPSVKAGHIAYLDAKAVSSAFSSASVLGLTYALEKATPMFAAALAG